MTNKIFGKNFDKSNVIALWTDERLLAFTGEQLDNLESLTKEEAEMHEGNGVLCRRLLLRISHARKAKEGVGEKH